MDTCTAWAGLVIIGNFFERCTLHNFTLINRYYVKSESHDYISSEFIGQGGCHFNTLPQIGSNNPKVEVVAYVAAPGFVIHTCISWVEIEGPAGLPYKQE